MNKVTLAVLASVVLISACTSQSMQSSGQKHDKTYVVGSNSGPVRNGDSCIVAAGNSGTYFADCGGSAAVEVKATMEAAQPKPKVITKVIVDCTKCKK